MLKLFAAALLAASALAVNDYCCELYPEASYVGPPQEVCPKTDIHGNMKVTAKSFKDYTYDGKMSSFKCGTKVHAQMCPEAFKSKFSYTTWKHEYTCHANNGTEGIFATDINRANGNLETPNLGINEDNFLSSIVLGQCVGTGQCGGTLGCPPPQKLVNGVCTCPSGQLPVNGTCNTTPSGIGFACNDYDCEGTCLPIPSGGVADTLGFFTGHTGGTTIKSIKMDPNMTVEYYDTVSFGSNSHNVANKSSLKICTQVNNGANMQHHTVNSITAYI